MSIVHYSTYLINQSYTKSLRPYPHSENRLSQIMAHFNTECGFVHLEYDSV